MRNSESGQSEMLRCDKCEYETRYKRALKSHLLVHKDISEVTIPNEREVSKVICPSTRRFQK
ncbi:hypothetical protein NQ317_018849 [Molorchus minor]|uniref:C2H2-type domain-containing protein n=1 Tax=Molorchus minor TaxID=1323400 RepID=A0ABQ9IQ23_9CUCU|nr:hypothetical protein NQ317_018849 [Molorchus minor]